MRSRARSYRLSPSYRMRSGSSWLLLFVCLDVLLEFSGGDTLLDFSGPVNATASSSYVVPSNSLEFAPQLAIQADTTYVWATCFLSKKESSPWFRLEFKSMTSIFNVWLGVRDEAKGDMPEDFVLNERNNLSVYVSNSSDLGLNGEQLCGSSLEYMKTNAIHLDCGPNLKGRFVYVTVPSSSPTYLSICSIILNRENGPPLALSLAKEGATVVSSGFIPSFPPELAIDGRNSCSSLTGAGKTWLRVNIQTVCYIREVLLLLRDKGLDVTVMSGRSLRGNGAQDNTACSKRVVSSGKLLHWETFICEQPILGQFIYIESQAKSLQICEVEAFYGNILNIYSPVRITASDQREGYGSIWKPVDGVHGTAVKTSWKSLKSSQSWWRMELSHRSAISRVVIYPPKLTPGRIEVMNGFAVYIGDSSMGNGSSNAICGEPWKPSNVSMMTFNCLDSPVGKYLYVAAADGKMSSLSLSEISVYECEGPPAPADVINITHVSPSNFTVTWNKPTGCFYPILHYAVSYRKRNGDNFIFFRNVSATLQSSTVTVVGLQPYTSYTVQVVPVSRMGEAAFSEKVEVATEVSYPSAPQHLTVNVTSSRSLLASWLKPEMPNGPIHSFRVYVHTVDDTESKQKLSLPTPHVIAHGSATSVNVTGLDKYTKYAVFVKAANEVHGRILEGGSSNTFVIRTAQDAPSAPLRVSAMAIDNTSLRIIWEAPAVANGIIEGYQIFYEESTKFAINNLTKNVTTRSATEFSALITNLIADTTYTVTMRAFTISYGNLSIPSQGRTNPSKPLPSTTWPNITPNEPEAASSSSIVIIAGAVATVVLVLLVIILVTIVVRRRASKGQYISSNTEMDVAEEFELEKREFVEPTVFAVESEIDSIAGRVLVLKIGVSGYPDPKVEWKCGGSELPGNEKRLDLLSDGSLQISNVQEKDAGLYQCTVSNRAGSAQCQIKLRVCPKAEKMGPVAVTDFERHVHELHSNRDHEFSLEFSVLDRSSSSDQSTSVASLACNKSKNRYINIVPFDHTRVVLKEIEDFPGSDYINASYVNAYGQPRGYIACQGPKKRTINDFWRMVWQEEVQTIVVVTNLEEKGKIKCSCYWPPVKKEGLYGAITVTFEEELVLSESTIRKFKLTHSEEKDAKPRAVTQFHFTGWPDHGVPPYATSLLNFVKRVRSHHNLLETQSPMVVHCSAGVGRTGTFIVVDYSFLRMKQEEIVDIFNLIKELRMQRPLMVQAEEQYIFCHDAVLEVMLCGDTSVTAPDLRKRICQLDASDPETGKTGFQKHLELLNKVSPGKRRFSYSGGMKGSNAAKNRSNNCIPPDESRVVLEAVPDVSTDSTYISAAAVDGYRQKEMYITTQGPLEHTIVDFWRLVWERNLQFIVMVTQLEENGEEMSAQYWPSEGSAEYDSMSVTKQDEKQLRGYTIRKFSLTNKKSPGQRIITQFHYLSWPDGLLPKNPLQLLDMMKRLERARQQADNKSVVVMCGDGVHRCGLFCAISIIVETLKTEQVVDIFQVVKALRLHNPDFVTELMDYKFCFNIAMHFLGAFDTYANFKIL